MWRTLGDDVRGLWEVLLGRIRTGMDMQLGREISWCCNDGRRVSQLRCRPGSTSGRRVDRPRCPSFSRATTAIGGLGCSACYELSWRVANLGGSAIFLGWHRTTPCHWIVLAGPVSGTRCTRRRFPRTHFPLPRWSQLHSRSIHSE